MRRAVFLWRRRGIEIRSEGIEIRSEPGGVCAQSTTASPPTRACSCARSSRPSVISCAPPSQAPAHRLSLACRKKEQLTRRTPAQGGRLRLVDRYQPALKHRSKSGSKQSSLTPANVFSGTTNQRPRLDEYSGIPNLNSASAIPFFPADSS